MSGREAMERLLILAARFELSPEEHSEMRGILREGLDWVGLLSEGGRLGALPLLHLHLSKGDERLHVPPDVLAALEKGYRGQSLQNLRIYGMLLKILRALNEKGIPVILLKGAFLSTQLYPDMALRPMSDIDLLCRPEDVLRAQDLVLSLGFRHLPSHYPSAVHERVQVRRHRHLPHLTSGVVGVEVHSRIFEEVPFGTFSPESLWQESRACALEEAGFRSLCTEHQLLHLCTHLYEHVDSGKTALYWFCDIHEFLRKHRHAIDWTRLYDIARRLGITDRLRSVLHIMSRHWESPVPVEERLPAAHNRFDFLQPAKLSNRKARIHNYFKYVARVRNIGSARDRLIFLVGFLFPSKEYMAARYNIEGKTMLIPAYLYHPFALAAQAADSIFVNLLHAFKKHS